MGSSGFDIDIGNMSTFMKDFPETPDHQENLRRALVEARTLAHDAFLRQLDALPFELTEDGKVVCCPAPVCLLPRENPIPDYRKPETPWRVFAKKQGIKPKGRRLNKIWDEDTREWRDKWGKRAREHKNQYNWLEEIKSTSASNSKTPHSEDPFLFTTSYHTKRSKKNKIRQKRGEIGSNLTPFDAVQQSYRVGSKSKRKGIGSRDRAKIEMLTYREKYLTTSSMGRFDKIMKRT